MEDRFDHSSLAALAGRSLMVHRANGDLEGQVRALLRLGNLASNQADFAAALDYLHEADDLARQLDLPELDREVLDQLTGVLLELGDTAAALPAAQRGIERSETGGPEERMFALNTMGCALDLAGRHEEALGYLQRAHALIAQITDASGQRKQHYEAQSLGDQSAALQRAGRHAEALGLARQGQRIAAANGNDPLVQLNARYAGRALLAAGDAAAAIGSLDLAMELARRMGLGTQLLLTQFDRAEALATLGRHREAYEAQLEGRQLEQSSRRDSAARRLEFRKARDDIEKARRDAESAHRVLVAVLPEPIARRIQAGEQRIAEVRPSVSVLFADMVGFTAMSRTVTPRVVLDRLDGVFTLFDRLTADAGLDKIKTIGDAYMAVGGALGGSGDHPERCLRLALRMQEELAALATASGFETRVRIGMHVGPAIAGVIGRQRLSFDLWGDTVNFAARLESSGVAGRVHVSREVAALLAGKFRFAPRPAMDLKGIGPVETFFLEP